MLGQAPSLDPLAQLPNTSTRAGPPRWPRHGGEPGAGVGALRAGALPHLHDDLDERFPKAMAGRGMEDEDPLDNNDLELRGERIGKQGVRFR